MCRIFFLKHSIKCTSSRNIHDPQSQTGFKSNKMQLSKISHNITNIHISLEKTGYYSKLWTQYGKPLHTLSFLPVKIQFIGLVRALPVQTEQPFHSADDGRCERHRLQHGVQLGNRPKYISSDTSLSHLTQYFDQTTKNTFIPLHSKVYFTRVRSEETWKRGRQVLL